MRPLVGGGGDRMSRRVQTLLCTDIVGSTDRLLQLGDATWAALLARHHGAIRAVLATHGGREVDTAGDGFLSSLPEVLHVTLDERSGRSPMR